MKQLTFLLEGYKISGPNESYALTGVTTVSNHYLKQCHKPLICKNSKRHKIQKYSSSWIGAFRIQKN